VRRNTRNRFTEQGTLDGPIPARPPRENWSFCLFSAQYSYIQLCKNRKSFYCGLRCQEPASFGNQDQMISAQARSLNGTSGVHFYFHNAFNFQNSGNFLRFCHSNFFFELYFQ
jgi:hypothetical protein